MIDVERISKYLDDNFDRTLEDVRAFLRQPSISYTGEGIRETGETLIRWIQSLGGAARLVSVEGGYHPVVYGRIDSGAPRTLLIYGMYDVMPADEPGWIAPPFGAEIHDWEDQGPCIINRGSTNTKGPLISFLLTLRAILAVEGKLPVNLIFAIEGEEEYGSRSFPGFVAEHLAELLEAEAMLFPMFGRDVDGTPAIRLGTKGPLYFELKCTGGDWGGPTTRGVHGSNNVWVASPAWRMVKALSTMIDADQRITIKGFFDQVRPPTDEDIALCRKLAESRPPEVELRTHDVTRIKWDMDPLQAYLTAQTQPQLNIDGIWGGYTGPGTKTLLPHETTVKMDVRTVPDMDSETVIATMRRHLDEHGYSDVEMKVINDYTWSKVSLEAPIVQALVASFRQVGLEPAVYPLNIGSAPFYVFDRVLKIPYVFGGMGHGARAHSSNEYISVPGVLDFQKSMVRVLDNYLSLVG